MLDKIRHIGEYILAVVLIYGGGRTAFRWQSDSVLSAEFFTPYLVLLFGIAFVVVGLVLLYSKVRKSPVWEGYCLYTAFLLLLFSLILEVTVYLSVADWIDNLILLLFALVLRVGYFIKEGVRHDGGNRRVRDVPVLPADDRPLRSPDK